MWRNIQIKSRFNNMFGIITKVGDVINVENLSFIRGMLMFTRKRFMETNKNNSDAMIVKSNSKLSTTQEIMLITIIMV